MNKLKYLFTVICAGALLATPAYAQGPGAGMGIGAHQHGIGKVMKFLESLDLSAEQKTQAVEIVKAHRDDLRPKADELREAQRNLMSVIHQETFDEAAVRLAYKKVASAGEELAVERAQLANQLRSILSEEQKSLLKETHGKLSNRFDGKVAVARALFDTWIDKQGPQE